MANEIVPVTADLIRKMRDRGDWNEAAKLLQAFHKQGKKNKKQLNKEIISQDRQIKKTMGYCVNSGCNNQISKHSVSHCDMHYQAELIYNNVKNPRGRKK